MKSTRISLLWIAFLGLCLGSIAIAQKPVKPQKSSGFQMSVGVTLMSVTVAVLDNKNRYRTDLEQKDFQLLVDGELTEITDFSRTEDDPLDLAVLLDVSGSMRFDDKFGRSRWMLRELLTRLRPEETVALMTFADGRIEVPVPFTADREKFLSALDSLQAYGKTALSDAMIEASNLVEKQDSLSPALILITDAFDNASKTAMDQSLSHLRQKGIPVYPLAVVSAHMAEEAKHPDAGSDFELLSKIASDTGGRSFVVLSAGTMAEAVNGIEKDLRARYRLGFYVPDLPNAAQTVSVNLPERNFKARYRRGYKP